MDPKGDETISPALLSHQQPEASDATQHGSMLSCCFWPEHLNVTAEIQVIRAGSILPVLCVNCSCSFLFKADRRATQCGLLLLLQGLTSYIQGCSSTCRGCNGWLLLPQCQLKAVWPFPSDLWHQKDTFAKRAAAHWIFFFQTILCNTRDGFGKTQQFWKYSDQYTNHVTFKAI